MSAKPKKTLEQFSADDAPVPPRANVITCDFAPDDDGGKGGEE